MITRRLAAIAVAALLCVGPATAQDKQPPLRTGVDGTFAPHAMPKLGGGTEGFQIDVFTEVAKRMKRDITIDSVSFSTLIPGMQAGRYDFIAAPTTVTKERAENMLFTAGYLWTAFQFGIKKGTPPIKGWEDLKGKSVAVNKGTPYETLSKQMGEKYGFTVQPTTPNPMRYRRCCPAAPTPRSAATPRSSMPRTRTRSSWPTSSSRTRAPTGRRPCRRTIPSFVPSCRTRSTA